MKRLVVFIYGLKRGDSKFGDYFPDLLKSDPQLSELYRSASYNYHFGLFRYLFSKKESVIDELSRRLRKKLFRKHKRGYIQIALICHGIGGLVARQYMVQEMMSQRPLKVDRVLMFSTPNTKADLKRISGYFPWKDRLERNLCGNTDYLEKLNREWSANSFKEKIAMKCVYGTQDSMVDIVKAAYQWGAGYFESVGKKDHWSLFTPKSHDDPAYLIAKRFLLAEEPVQKKYPSNLLSIADVLNWELSDAQRESAQKDIVHLVDLLDQLQWRSRQLLCALIQKANQVNYGEMFVSSTEISKTMNLTVQELKNELGSLEAFDFIDIVDDVEPEKICLKWPDEKWLIWDQLKGFCQKTGISLRRLIIDLQFDLLDSKKMAS